jgi:hypothetical protein
MTHEDGTSMPKRVVDIRGLFKKRPNFLNRAPTSKDSALRLLIAHSISFDKKLPFVPLRYEH